MGTVHMRRVRSFVKRPGRLTASQARALEALSPRFCIEFRDAILSLDAVFGRNAARVLDIGFGDGEALLTAAARFPGIDYLGVLRAAYAYEQATSWRSRQPELS